MCLDLQNDCSNLGEAESSQRSVSVCFVCVNNAVPMSPSQTFGSVFSKISTYLDEFIVVKLSFITHLAALAYFHFHGQFFS